VLALAEPGVADIFADEEEEEARGPVHPAVVGEIPVIAPASRDIYADAFAMLEEHGHKPFEVRLNPRDYADFRKWDPPFEEQACEGVEGVRGTLWDRAVVKTTLEAPVGVAVVMSGDDPPAVVRILLTR
jgi:hypothetical protein